MPDAALTLAVIYVIGTPAISAQYAISFPLAAEGADEVGLPHGIVLGAMNVCWGFGFFVGPALGAAIAEVTSDRVTYLLATMLSLAALPLLRALALSPQSAKKRLDGRLAAAMIVAGTPPVRVPNFGGSPQ